MEAKLFDAELKVMEVLWREGDLPAKRITEIMKGLVGWNKNTTYTVLKRCVEKGVIERREPNFICHAALSKGQMQEYETTELINRAFDGSADLLFASILSRKTLTPEEIARLKQIVNGLE